MQALQGVSKRIIKKADPRRVARAVEAITSGAWHFDIGSVKEGTVKAYVSQVGKEQRWAVKLSPRSASCSCPDCFYAGQVCKHIIGLALQVEVEAAARAKRGSH